MLVPNVAPKSQCSVERLDADAELFLEVGSTAVLCVTEDGLCGKGTRRLPSEGDPTADPALTPWLRVTTRGEDCTRWVTRKQGD